MCSHCIECGRGTCNDIPSIRGETHTDPFQHLTRDLSLTFAAPILPEKKLDVRPRICHDNSQ